MALFSPGVKSGQYDDPERPNTGCWTMKTKKRDKASFVEKKFSLH
jgi:nitrogen fixation-related uncharacterized protein